MFRYDRLESLIAESGESKAWICRKIERPVYYLRDVIKQKNNIPADTQERLAEILNTTVDYLNGRTDIKEKPASVGDRMSKEISEMIRLFEKAGPEPRAAALAVLRDADRRKNGGDT